MKLLIEKKNFETGGLITLLDNNDNIILSYKIDTIVFNHIVER